MTAESLLTTYVQVGVAISGFSGIVVALGKLSGRVVPPRPPAPVRPARVERRVRYSRLPLVLASTGLPEPTVWAASSGCSVVLQLGLMVARARSSSATRTRSPESSGCSPGYSPARWCAWRRTGELCLAGCRLAAPGHDHVAPRRVLHRLRAARPTRGPALRPRSPTLILSEASTISTGIAVTAFN